MDTQTGRIDWLEKLRAEGVPEKYLIEIDPTKLPPRTQRQLKESGHAVLHKNARCPCGSGKRFNKCCFRGSSVKHRKARLIYRERANREKEQP